MFLSLGCLSTACASTGPVEFSVQQPQNSVNSLLVLPAQFTSFPVGGRELWQINRLITRGLARHGSLAIIDSRELTLKEDQDLPMPVANLLTQSDLESLLSWAETSAAKTLVVSPLVVRHTRRVTRKRSGAVQAGMEVTVSVTLELRQISSPEQLLGVVSFESKTPAFYIPAEGEDPAESLFAAVRGATQELVRRLRPLRGPSQAKVNWLKDNLALMARMDSTQVRSVLAVPNEIERLTQVSFLADLAFGQLRGREVEKRLESPPGLRVVVPYGQHLKVGDVITEIGGRPAVSPFQMARMVKVRRSHLQVLREDKLVDVTLPQE